MYIEAFSKYENEIKSVNNDNDNTKYESNMSISPILLKASYSEISSNTTNRNITNKSKNVLQFIEPEEMEQIVIDDDVFTSRKGKRYSSKGSTQKVRS